MASINDVAKRAGVSKTTVSVIMNGRSREYGISTETEERIKKVAKECNYTPSNLARGLRLKETKSYGLIVPDLNNWFFSEISQSLERILRDAGYRLYITSSQYNEELEYRTIEDLLSWNIDGLIIASVIKRDKVSKHVLKHDTPIVYIDRRVEGEYVSWVASDNFKGSYDLVNHMCSKGAREICYIGGARTVSTLENRLKGYKKALGDNGISFDEDLVFEKGATPEDAYDLAKRVYKKWKGFPEAIYTASCDFMMGFLQFMRENAKKVPPDIRLGTFDDNILLDFLEFKVDSVRQDTQGMSRAAYELIKKAQKGEREVAHEVIQPTLVIRS